MGGGGLSPPLWFTKGEKQGCVLSHTLYALYISSLCQALHGLREGVDVDSVVISALFFADDKVLISRIKKGGLEKMLWLVNRFYVGRNTHETSVAKQLLSRVRRLGLNGRHHLRMQC